MKLPAIWISADGYFLVILDKVTSVTPGSGSGGIIIRSGAGVVALDKANAKDFVAALVRFHLHSFPKSQPRSRSKSR